MRSSFIQEEKAQEGGDDQVQLKMGMTTERGPRAMAV